MMPKKYKVLRNDCIILFFVILSMLMRYISFDNVFYRSTADVIRPLIYIGMIFLWRESIKRRIFIKSVRFYITSITSLMIFWMILRTMRAIFFDDYFIRRMLWYSYYIPMLFIPLLGLFFGIYLGKSERHKPPEYLKVLWIPAFILCILVLTNDIHQAVFSFGSNKIWTSKDYKYETMYFVVLFFNIIYPVLTLSIIVKKSKLPNKKILILPNIAMFTLIIYIIIYVVNVGQLWIIRDVTVKICLFIMIIIESCIRSGLIQSNDNYEELFNACSVPMKILNEDYETVYNTKADMYIEKKYIKEAIKEPILLNRNIKVNAMPINAGYMVWLDNLSKMNLLLDKLNILKGQLLEKNILLKAEIELEKRKSRVEEKNKIIEKIMSENIPSLAKMNNILENNASLGIEVLKRLCILGAYVKRRCNLLLLSYDNENISSKELEYCIRESMDSISRCNINCNFTSECNEHISIKHVIVLYDLFENVVECMLSTFSDFNVNIFIKNDNLYLSMKLVYNMGNIPLKEYINQVLNNEKFKDMGGVYALDYIENEVHITMCMLK